MKMPSGKTLATLLESDWTDAATISDITDNEFELTLDFGTEYVFRIMAVNDVGSSSYSPALQIKTAGPDTPTKFTVNVVDNVVTLSWAPGDESDTYTVQYMVMPDGKTLETLLESDWMGAATISDISEHELELTLDYATEYVFRISATNDAGTSNYTSAIRCETAQPIAHLVVTPDSHSATISWSPGILPEDISGYQYKESTSSEWIAWVTSTTATVTITGLKANTAYDFRVVDASGEQIGEVIQKSTKAAVGTPIANPVKPKVSVVKKGDDKPTISSVTLTWDALPKKATAESNVVYIITCTTPDSGIMPIAISGTGKLSHTFAGLKQNTTYKFTITAINADGKSVDAKNKVVAVKVTAKTLKYTAVQKLKLDKAALPSKGVTTDSIALTWTASKFSETTNYEVIWLEGKVEKPVSEISPTATVIITGTTATITGLPANTKYTFIVRALVKDSEGAVIHNSLSAKIAGKTSKA
jgi:hypothetical protein